MFLALIFICEIAGGIAAYVLRSDVDTVLTENMNKALNQYNATDHGGVTDTWNIMQHEVNSNSLYSLSFFYFILLITSARCLDSLLRNDKLH